MRSVCTHISMHTACHDPCSAATTWQNVQLNSNPVYVPVRRCYFENVTMRTGAISADRSICCFGPDCPAILMRNCELGGASGLLVPNSLGPRTKLILRNCHLHSVGSPMPAIAMEAGSLTAHGMM